MLIYCCMDLQKSSPCRSCHCCSNWTPNLCIDSIFQISIMLSPTLLSLLMIIHLNLMRSMFSSTIFNLQITSLWTSNLMTILACYPSFAWCLLLCNSIFAMRDFFWVVCMVMVSWLMTNGEATEPRALLWPADTWVCCWVRMLTIFSLWFLTTKTVNKGYVLGITPSN